MIKRYSIGVLFLPLNYYIAFLGIIGLFIFATIVIIYSSLVHENFTPVSAKYFFTNPEKILAAIHKEKITLSPIPPDRLPNFHRIEKHCLSSGCYLLLTSESYKQDMTTEELQQSFIALMGPTKISGVDDQSFAWMIPAQRSNDVKDLTPDLGIVVWDETRKLIIYQAFSAKSNGSFSKLYIRDYTKEWGFGLVHWIDMKLPASHLEMTGYDQTKGYLLFDHIDDVTNQVVRKSVFSVSDPELLTSQ